MTGDGEREGVFFFLFFFPLVFCLYGSFLSLFTGISKKEIIALVKRLMYFECIYWGSCRSRASVDRKPSHTSLKSPIPYIKPLTEFWDSQVYKWEVFLSFTLQFQAAFCQYWEYTKTCYICCPKICCCYSGCFHLAYIFQIANIYFDPGLQCGNHCYVGLPFLSKCK